MVRRLEKMISVLVIVLALQGSAALAGQVVKGKAGVVDGDTIAIGNKKIRLMGIDAPEAGQRCRRADGTAWRCGRESTEFLEREIGRQRVACTITGKDRYRRLIGHCVVLRRSGEEVNLNALMVASGLAMAYRRYSQRYVPQEDQARAAGVGMWSGTFMPPWEYRRNRRKVPRGSSAG